MTAPVETASSPAAAASGRSLPRRILIASLGPALIVAGVVVVLHAVVFGDRIVAGDITTFWLPNYCFLGKSLAAGHLPAWNPYSMAGVPFAADPQSGWMYLPAMALFTALPCDGAIRVMVVLQPVLAGLGLLWFLRSEGTGRVAATVSAVVLALGIAGSQIVISLPFAAVLAWTAVALAACSRLLHASTWQSRLLWSAATAVAWGQLAAAHFSVGMLMGTAILVTYVAAAAWRGVAREGRAGREVGLVAGTLLLALPLFNLAFLLPRLAYLPRTSLGQGYRQLQALSVRLTGHGALSLTHTPTGPQWPLKLATTPGAHLGAVALALAFAGVWNRRRRHLAVAFAAFGLVVYLLTLRVVADAIPASWLSFRLFDFYLHNPQWLGYELLLAVAVLAGLGVEAWIQAASARERMMMLFPGVVAWGVLPPLFGANPGQLALLGAGALAGGVVLVAGVRRPALVGVLPAVLAVELAVSGLVLYRPPPFGLIPQLLNGQRAAHGQVSSLLRADPVQRRLRSLPPGRVLTYDLGGWQRLQADPFSTVFHIEQVQGYNPVELQRYWSFVRAANPTALAYNLSLFVRPPPPVAMNLLGVAYVVARNDPFGTDPGFPVLARRGRVSLRAAPFPNRRATVVGDWVVRPSPTAALGRVTDPAFDPAREVVLEADPSIPHGPAGPAGTATYRALGPQAGEVRVTATSDALVLVRTPYDPDWHATVDGREAKVLPADFVDLAVPVSAGSHTVRLTYDDPWIGYGLAGSGLGAAGWIAALILARRRRGSLHRGA